MNKTQIIINATLSVAVVALLTLSVILMVRTNRLLSDSAEGEYTDAYFDDTTNVFDAILDTTVNMDSLLAVESEEVPAKAEAEAEEEKEEAKPKGKARRAKLPIAYVDMDRVNKEYRFVKDANARLNSMADQSRRQLQNRYNTLQQSLQKQEQDLIQRAQSGQITSEESFNRQRADLERKLQNAQAELAQMENRLAQQNEAELKKQSKELNSRINNFLKDYNRDGRYELILSNLGEINDNVLYSATPAYDITDDVIKGLNARYGKK